MPHLIILYVKYIDLLCTKVGRATMYLVFLMMFILVLSFVTRNIVNKENETRWSMNCRFKSLYSPYGDKKIGEFFEPITLRVASKIGMQYHLPKIND